MEIIQVWNVWLEMCIIEMNWQLLRVKCAGEHCMDDLANIFFITNSCNLRFLVPTLPIVIWISILNYLQRDSHNNTTKDLDTKLNSPKLSLLFLLGKYCFKLLLTEAIKGFANRIFCKPPCAVSFAGYKPSARIPVVNCLWQDWNWNKQI